MWTVTGLLYSGVEEELRASVRALLDERAPWPAVLARTESDEPYDPTLWTALARDIGVGGLPVSESAGGHSASWREVAVVAEELGRSVAGTPFLGSAVLATALATALAADDLVHGLASGRRTAGLAVCSTLAADGVFPVAVRHEQDLLTGTVRSVADALTADVFLVPAMGPDVPAVFLVDAQHVQRTPVISLDLTRPVADLTLDAAPGRLLASGERAAAALMSALTVGAAMLASEQIGLAQRCLELTVEHLRTRVQFARPIGSFQALKHRAADLWAEIAQARAVARYAAACIADNDADAPVAAALAQAYCAPVAVHAAEECLQLHGGIGFTWEAPVHLYLKRAKADALLLGRAVDHRTRLAALVDLPAT